MNILNDFSFEQRDETLTVNIEFSNGVTYFLEFTKGKSMRQIAMMLINAVYHLTKYNK